MSDPMNLINEHLDAIEAVLAKSGMGRPERRRIIDELEVQIHDMLEARGENPTEDDVRELLARLDPPEAYAGGDESAASHEPPLQAAAPVEQKFSVLAVIGAIWAPFVIFPILFTWVYPIWLMMIPYGGVGIHGIIGIIGLLAPFGATTLGWIAVSQIRHSNGRLYGTGLALFDGLFFPLLMLDWLIVCAWSALFVGMTWLLVPVGHGRLIMFVTLFLTLPLAAYTCFIIDRKIIRRSSGYARRPI